MRFIFQVFLVLSILALLGLGILSSFRESVTVGYQQIWNTSWGEAAVIDLFIGFTMLATIATVTETNKLMKWLWFPLTFFLGNFAIAIFLLRHLGKAQGLQGLQLMSPSQSQETSTKMTGDDHVKYHS
jgi:hypothetical protein